MSPLVVGWIVSAVLLVVAAGLLWRLRGALRQVSELAAKGDTLGAQLAASEKRFEERAKAQRKRGEEIAELKKKLEKARKRTATAHDARSGETSRLSQLEESLARAEAERLTAQREVDSLRADLERRPAVPRPVAKPVPAAPVAPSPAIATPAVPTATVDPLDHPAAQALAKRAEKAEGRARGLEGELVNARKDVDRYKRRAAALDTAYVAQHGELEAKRDRLKTQQEELERLRAMRVTLGATDAEAEPQSEPEPVAGVGLDVAPEADPSGDVV